MLFAAILACILLQRTSLCQESSVRILYENTTTYLAVNKLISLVGNNNFSLKVNNASSAPSIRISSQQLFQDNYVTSFTNEVFVDSFGFRFGNVSSNVFQMIITNKFINLYSLSPTPANLTLKLLNKWECNSLINKDPSKYYFANSSTVAIQQTNSMVEFIMIAVQNGTVNERMMALRVDAVYNGTDFNCKLTVTFQAGVLPMFFYEKRNVSNATRCESNLKYLDNSLSVLRRKRQASTQGANSDISPIYYARYCKMSQLPFGLQYSYINKLEIYRKDPNNTVTQVNLIGVIGTPENVSVSLQVVHLQEFDSKLILFTLDSTFVMNSTTIFNRSSDPQASQEFQNDRSLGFVDCQQNDYNVMSCYLDMYELSAGSGPPAARLAEARRRLCGKEALADGDIYNSSYFIEFIKTEDKLFMIPPIAFNKLPADHMITAINLNFLVFREYIMKQEGEALSKHYTLLSIMQRGTSDLVGTIQVKDTVIAMRTLGPNFMMYRDTDIGLNFKTLESGGKLNLTVSIYTIQLPHFRISAGQTNTSFNCFGYSKNCQLLEFNFSYIHDLVGGAQNEPQTIVQTLQYFHLNQNFSSIVPLTLCKIYKVDIVRDMMSFNLTSLLFGLPDSVVVRTNQYSPLDPIPDLYLGKQFEAFANFRINITGLDPYMFSSINPGFKITEVTPIATRYKDESFFVCLMIRLQHETYKSKFYWVIAQLPDKIDTNSDYEFVFSANNFQYFRFPPSSQDPNKRIVPIYNENFEANQFYLIYGDITRLSVCTAVDGGTFVTRVMNCSAAGVPPNLPLMKVKVTKSNPSKSADDCMILLNDNTFQVYFISYSSEGPMNARVRMLLMLEVAINDSSFEWPVGRPVAFTDVALVDFNVLYISLTVTMKDLSVKNIIQVHQCDFNLDADCYFYAWANRGQRKVYVDDLQFNFCLFDPSSLKIDVFRMTDFQREFVNIVKKEMTSVRTIDLKMLLDDSDMISYLAPEDLGRIDVSEGQIFTIFVIYESEIGFILFDTTIQVRPRKYFSTKWSKISPVVPSKNSFPFNFPLAYFYNSSSGLIEVVLINPSEGVVIQNPQKSTSPAQNTLFATDVFEVVMQTNRSMDYLQLIQGTTGFDYGIRENPAQPANTRSQSIDVSSYFRGFIQNLSIGCVGSEGFQNITRNNTVLLTCQNFVDSDEQSPQPRLDVAYDYVPHIVKDFDFVGNNYLSTGETAGARGLHDFVSMSNVTDFFTLNNSNKFVFILHNNISVVKTKNFSRIIATFSLLDVHTREPVLLENCLSIDEGVCSGDLMQVNLVCREQAYLLTLFNLNLTQITAADDSELQPPLFGALNASRYTFKSQTINPSYSSADSNNVLVVGELIFQLDSILLENYNNKPYLNAYQMVLDKDSETGERCVNLRLFWSSLSEESLAEYNISKFLALKIPEDHSGDRKYRMIILMKQEDKIACSLGNILVHNDSASFQLDSCSFPDVPDGPSIESLKLYNLENKIYVYGFTEDQIVEWFSYDFSTFLEGERYKFLMACDLDSSKLVARYSPFFLLYCHNSTSIGTSDDTLLIYNTQAAGLSSPYFPIQQLIFPDVDSPSNRILTVFQAGTTTKLLMASTRSFITQYTLNRDSNLTRLTDQQFTGTRLIQIQINAENVLSSSSLLITFEYDYLKMVTKYTDWVLTQTPLVVILLCYLLSLACFFNYRQNRSRLFDSKKKFNEDFVHYYQKIMNNEELFENLRPDEVDSLFEKPLF